MMGGMKLQFGTRGLLLAAATAAIVCAGAIAWGRVYYPSGTSIWPILYYLTLVGPLWTPFAFITFAIGQKSLTTKMVIAFAIAETIAVGIQFGAGLLQSQ